MTLPKILILEDIEFDLELIQASLFQGGIEAECVSVDSREGFLAALRNHHIDLVLADYSLPGFDGLNALEIVQTICPEVPFILVSGILGEEPAIETLKQGATDYVLKQRLSRLAPAVKRALREQQERQTRERVEAALEASQERFRASVETMLDCFGLYSAIRDQSGAIEDFRIEYLNAAACERLGGESKLLQGRRLCQLFPFHQETVLFEAYCQVVETGVPFMQEVLMYAEDAEELKTALDVRAAQLEDGIVVTWRDITVRKQEEREREDLLVEAQSARQEAEAASRIKDEFLATLSHELRTPLNAMQGWVQILQRRRLDEAMTDRAFDTIQRNMDALKRLIEDVLDVSRIIRGKLRLNVATTDVSAVARAAIDTMSPAIKAKQIQLKVETEDDLPPVLGDRNRLQQVIWNLLSNAVKFTPEEGRITVRLDTLERFVRIQVQDSGKGIDPGFLPHIFERFRQADSSTTRSHSGLGLGLAIVRHLIELHGGVVQAESPGLGQGAIFTVMLPQMQMRIDQDLNGYQLRGVGEDSRGSSLPNLEELKILVVDDDADARELFTTVLAELGAVVSTVESSDEALALVASFRPDVLISDISMPGVDGYRLIEKIRLQDEANGLGNRQRLAAIALTAYASPEDCQKALEAGFDMHLAKPVEVHQLTSAVSKLGGLHQAAPLDSAAAE